MQEPSFHLWKCWTIKPELAAKLLKGLAEWCIRYTPAVAVDLPDGLILDVSGCAHLWGGEKQYLTAIYTRFKDFGYDVSLLWRILSALPGQ